MRHCITVKYFAGVGLYQARLTALALFRLAIFSSVESFCSEDGLAAPDMAEEKCEPEKSEDDIQREKNGPRNVPGNADEALMTPQQEKNIQKHPDPGHIA